MEFYSHFCTKRCRMAQLGHLPEELLLIIFRNLPTSNLQNIALVCKKWKRVTHDFSLYHRIVIDSTLKQAEVRKLLKTYNESIEYIQLKNRNDTNELLLHVRNIANLNNKVNVNFLRKVLNECSKITSLEVRQTTFKYGMRNFYPTNTRLEKLRIKSDNNLEIFERRLEDMINLRDLRLQGVKLYDDRILIRICMNNKYTLTVLKLDVWKLPIDEKRDDELMQFIGRCTHLTKLSLQNYSASGLTDIGFGYLSNLKRLRSLVVTNAKRVSARAIMRLFYEPHVQHLQKINLGRCPELHQLVLKFIADRCPNLRKLYVDQFGSSCPCIGVVDLQYISERCPRLEHLELCSMGYAVGEALPSILKKFNKLRSFKYFVRPLKDYFAEYDPIVRKSKQELPKFHIRYSLNYGIVGNRK
ncbi:hypothetical protein PGB90_002663 [Kerria lacca]